MAVKPRRKDGLSNEPHGDTNISMAIIRSYGHKEHGYRGMVGQRLGKVRTEGKLKN